ncbi:MAG: hypothetical protein M3177_00665 [Pseudomonadota bacterium]|nr:hypothetical protein [Pseudomonadota bacterium]
MAATPPDAGWRRFTAAAFWVALLAAFIMAVLPQPPELPGRPSDKLLHLAAFAILTALATLAYPRLHPVRLLLGLSAFGALIELVQAVPTLRRDSDWVDWVADTCAILAVQAATLSFRGWELPGQAR